jgi:hypothetical protein
MIVVKTNHDSNRLQYACRVFFTQIMQIPWRISGELSDEIQPDNIVVSYGCEDDRAKVYIPRSGLLDEKGVHPISHKSDRWNGVATLFHIEGGPGLPFDLFSAVFFLASRYEEYLPFKADRNGRFEADQSTMWEFGFLETPIIDIWAEHFKDYLANHGVTGEFPKRQYRFISTIDVDSAYAYRYKGLMRTLGGFAKDLLAFDLKNAGRRMSTLIGRTHDPYDTYDELKRIYSTDKIEAIFFFLMADYGLNDKNVPHTSVKYQLLIKDLADHFETGVHPGFMSNTKRELLTIEIERLSQIVHRQIVKSRQHFLILNLPDTYSRLLEQGVTDDYSMGFASQPGFRLGTCTPIPFYNLRTEQTTPLILHPFSVMDATLNMYMNLTPKEAIERIQAVADAVKRVNGEFITVWHNESISEAWHWKGWSKVFKETTQYAAALREN